MTDQVTLRRWYYMQIGHGTPRRHRLAAAVLGRPVVEARISEFVRDKSRSPEIVSALARDTREGFNPMTGLPV